jgi:hypothetical protein
MADTSKRRRRKSRDTKRGKHGPALAAGRVQAGPGSKATSGAAGGHTAQSSDNLDKFSISGEVRSDGASSRRCAIRRFPVVDSAVAARERVAWQALAAFGAAGTGPGRRGVAATSDTTQRRWGGKDAVPPPADEAAVGSKVNTKGKGARSDGAQANADESAVVTSAEDANTDVGFDVDLPSDEADIDREWADVSPTVRDSAPTPQHGRADLSQDPAPTGAP